MTKNESKSSNLCSVLNCSIPPSLFGAAVLMGNQSSNKLLTLGWYRHLLFLSLRDTNNTDIESGHVYQGHTTDPTLHLCPGGWALICVLHLLYIWVWLRQIYMDSYHMAVWRMCLCTPFVCPCIQRCMFIPDTFTVCTPVSLQAYEYDYGDETYEDPQPLNCSTTESIKDGHVTYSQVKIIHCRLELKWFVD